MNGVDEQAAPVGVLSPQSDLPAPVADPVSYLTEVYRDFPRLRALILPRVRDPEVSADILQDAEVTTLTEPPAKSSPQGSPRIIQRRRATAARRMLEEMPVARDREILVRFYDKG